ncbi:receptor-interacting serine/threonine-protein kinase 2-like [Scyliorhinus canicula]|uniref:receptor-interacting serine/threonine-protein kinase 2-like n=1 Tax=Scyliorhinus canicula TaxID=7830 RepID=UPI0018F44942|nr:receptor-interacting serine/threonine-protein kinase 2-like [Scyliorhinus canicula]
MEREFGGQGCPRLAEGLQADSFPENPASHFTNIHPQDLQRWRHIGSGGFGEVYEARHRAWGISVAIKFLRMNPKDEHGLFEEGTKMHKAQFEHILRLYGVTKRCFENGISSLGMVTEFMEKGSLDKLLECGLVPWPLRLRFAYEIALGMNYLHNLKPALFHHDLKPANILLNKDYRIKICDFGLAKWRLSTSQNSNNGKIEGTLYYMPPECFKDINTRKSVKYDVYSYGIVIWQIVTCQKPYKHAANSQHLKLCVGKGDRPDIGIIPDDRPESSDVLLDLMGKCWHENPDERPTFRKCVHELESKQSNEQDLQIAIQALTRQESQCVDGHITRSTPESSEDISNLCEPVEEQNEPKQFLEPAQNPSQEEIVKCPQSTFTSDECIKLAELVNKDWRMLGRTLGLTEGDISCIDYDYNGLIEKAYQILQKWIQTQGKNANPRSLVFYLKKMKREDLALLFSIDRVTNL